MNLKNFVVNAYKKTDKIALEIIKKPFYIRFKKKENLYTIDKIGYYLGIIKFIICLFLSVLIMIISNNQYFSSKYISYVINIIDWSTDIFIALFGVVLTVFSITIALWSKLAIKNMAEMQSDSNNDFSILEELLISYMSLMFWCITIIIVNFITKTILLPLPDNWTLGFIHFEYCEILASILLLIYIYIILSILFETFVLLLNLYTSTVVILYLNVKDNE